MSERREILKVTAVYSVDIEEKIDAVEWNKYVSSVPEGTIFQTTYWADYLRGTGYCRPYFCSVSDQTGYKGMLLFWIEDLSGRMKSGGIVRSLCSPLARKMGFAYAYWIYGPLVFDTFDSKAIIRAMLESVDRFTAQQRVIVLHNVGEPIHLARASSQSGHPEIYRSLDFVCSRRATLFVNLDIDVDTAWKRLKKSTRKDVSSCARHGLSIGLLSRDGLEEYLGVIRENVARVNADFPPYYPDDNMWDALRRDESHLEILAVRKDGRIMGGAGIIDYNGIICHMTTCQSNESFARKINVNDLLTWEIMKWGIEKRRRIYDLTGVPLEPRNQKETGLLRFKMKWSDDMRIYNAYNKVYRKTSESIICLARTML